MPQNRQRRKTPKSLDKLPSDLPPEEVPEWLEHLRRSVEENTPLMRTLIMRSINAVMRFEILSKDAIVNATEAKSDLEVLLRALSSEAYGEQGAA